MTIHIEVEEGFGRAWHRFITRRASPEFEDAAVRLDDVRRSLLLLFRGTGGEAGVGVEAASARELLVRRSLLQQVAGTCQQLPVAWFDADSLRLPAQLAVYPDAELNRELYRWLALLAAHSQPMRHWARDNQGWTLAVLERYPLLRLRYQRLVDALLSLRPDPGSLPPAEAELERALQQALRAPGSVAHLPRSEKAPWPVPLWLYPPQRLAAPQHADLVEGDEQGRSAHSEVKGLARKRAERTEQDPGRGGLLLFRLENLFSWSEHVELDRAGDDSEDLDAAKVADDLDHLSLSRHRQKKGGGLKLDLDLPAAEFDDIPLGEGIRLPEWDHRRQQLLADHVCLQPMLPRDAPPAPLPDALAPVARRLRRQFESLRQQPQWLHRQPQGTELDLDAWLDFSVERRLGACSEPGLFRERRQARRDLACLLLADLSMSTDAHIDNEHRVIDLISDSLLLFGEALQAVGDRFALYGFSSLRRHQVRMTQLKSFDERHNDTVRGRIRALRPGYYTRMGAAIRRATQLLLERKERQRVLLILTDGKPNDLDCYEGRYGVEDTRQAVLEARRAGLLPFCITIDREAADYLPYLFGSQGYLLLNDPAQLPVRLPQLYRQLTRRQG